MTKRKVIVEVDLNDDRINSIEDLEQEILAQDIYGVMTNLIMNTIDKCPYNMTSEKCINTVFALFAVLYIQLTITHLI
jgi:hypothetical protein